MPSDLFKVVATFQDPDGNPLTGEAYKVSLLDEDHLFDDKLGECGIDSNGTAKFLFSVADIFSIDSPEERKPEIYFVVRRDGTEIFRSDVFHEVDFDAVDPVTKRPKGLTKEFGPFKIDA